MDVGGKELRRSYQSKGEHMTKTELLDLMWLLSALETAMYCSKTTVPDHVFRQIDAAVVVLKREILG